MTDTVLARQRQADEVFYQRLLPCPFCGGSTFRIEENGKLWTGQKYSDPVSVSVMHWCQGESGPTRVIERVGRDRDSAVAAWNRRAYLERMSWPL